jgi:ABC-type transport system substrate-binding protein
MSSTNRTRRFVVCFRLAVVVALLGGAGLAAQNPPRKPPLEEEESPDKQVKPKKPVPRLPDEEEPTTRTAPSGDKAVAQALPVLEQAAKQADNATLKDLFESLKYPYDRITVDGRDKPVVPLTVYLGPRSTGPPTVYVQFYDNLWKPTAPNPMARKDLGGVEHYEAMALRKVDALLNEAKNLNRRTKLEAAEKVLSEVARFHEAAHESGRRPGNSWDALQQRLTERLQAVRLELLHTVADAADWGEALALAKRLRVYRSPKVQEEIADQLARMVQQSLERGNYREVHLRLHIVEDLFRTRPALTDPIKNKLRLAATNRLDKLKADLERSKGEKDPDKMRALHAKLAEVESIWPLPELRGYRTQLTSTRHAILGVGVRALPEYLSPGTAVLDSERQAVELQFESLVVPVTEPGDQQQRYESVLALGRPRLVPLGRQFELVRDAYWSDGKPVTSTDVRRTVQLLRHPGWPGHQPAWAELLDPPPPETEAFKVGLTLHQGFLDPLSLMTFKVLPATGTLDRPDSPEFARKPVGSGPFQLQERQGNDPPYGKYVQFTANPYFRRAGKSDRPAIHEIRFFQPDNPELDMKSGVLHLLLDPTPENLRRFHSLDYVDIKTLPNRRIYFLAVNHRTPVLASKELRKALAHAIDRAAIVRERFREGLPAELPAHWPLNGPYPPGSWACNPKVPADLLQPELAGGLARQAKAFRAGMNLSLKYPEGDPRVAKACEDIHDMVAKVTGIQLTLKPTAPRQLHRDVELLHDYELAYYHYDYPSEALWLWPLFDSHPRALASGGGNFLGYQNDSELERQFRQAMGHRDPARVKEFTHNIHELLYEKMPLIPLWQLDTVLVIHKDLKALRIDPLLIFTHAEEWELATAR